MSKRKATSDTSNLNQDICDLLMELANYERDVGKNIFKYNAYRKAAGTLSALPERVNSGKEAKKLPGIGDKIAKKIDEFIETGKLQKIENIKKDESDVADSSSMQESGATSAKIKKSVDASVKKPKNLKKRQGKSTKKSLD